jgi:hypothetical protein
MGILRLDYMLVVMRDVKGDPKRRDAMAMEARPISAHETKSN